MVSSTKVSLAQTLKLSELPSQAVVLGLFIEIFFELIFVQEQGRTEPPLEITVPIAGRNCAILDNATQLEASVLSH